MIKIAIVIDPDLPTGLLANAVACITSGLFLDGKEYVGPEVAGKDVTFVPITKIPIPILKPGKVSLADLCKQAHEKGLTYVAFTKEAQTTTSYEEYEKRVVGKGIDEVTMVGLGIVGDAKAVNALIGSLPMLR